MKGNRDVGTGRTWILVGAVAVLAAALCALAMLGTPDHIAPPAEPPQTTVRTVPDRAALPASARITSYEQARRGIDPQVFQPVGPGTYQIIRLGAARPPGDALAFVQSRVQRARAGDFNATFEIYLAVRDCQNSISGDADKALALEVQGGVDPQELSTSERKLAECSSLAGSSDLWNEHWLDMAARQGSVEAQLMYAVDVASVLGSSSQRLANPEKTLEWKETARSYLEQVAATGNLDAMVRLSAAYGKGVFVQRSSERSYAYALAANRMKPGTFDAAFMASLKRELPTQQQEWARSLSGKIYDACCAP